MGKIGRPKGRNNKEYNYSLRLDEETKSILEEYCTENNVAKSEAIREAILRMSENIEKEVEENENN